MIFFLFKMEIKIVGLHKKKLVRPGQFKSHFIVQMHI